MPPLKFDAPLQLWTRYGLAAAAGVVWALSFPLPGIAGLAWIAPGMLLLATAGAERGNLFRAGYLAGAIHYLISLSWLRLIPFPAGAYTGWFALSFFLALFPPLWAFAAWRLARGLGVAPSAPGSFKSVADSFAAAPWLRLNVWFLLCAAAWVAWEMVIARIFGGFPWNLLGASQYRLLPVIQIASVTGVYGVSFLVAWFSASMFAGVLLLVRHPERATLWRRTLVFPALILVAVAGSGFVAVLSQPAQPRHLRVALIQPSIPQTVIFDPEGSEERFEILLRLTTEALAAGPDIVIWPEASLPGGLRQEDMDRLRGLIRTARVWMVFGADDVEEAPGAGDESIPFRAFNSAFLMDPRGEVIERYRKRRLVMFGEYIPLSRWLPFLKRLAPIGDGFHPGERPVSFVMAGLDATTSALICFEDNFPHLARQHATRDVDFLLNLTNDAWFGRSSAQWQHAANAVFRAIENGIPLVRCANNGLSCWVDATGRMHSARLAAGGNVYDAGFEIATLAFGQPLPTFYRKIGDVFGWACVLATVTGLALRLPPASAARGSRRDPGSGD